MDLKICLFIIQHLRIDKGTEYITGWKSKGLDNSKRIALLGALFT